MVVILYRCIDNGDQSKSVLVEKFNQRIWYD
jgi:hypothetical protein